MRLSGWLRQLMLQQLMIKCQALLHLLPAEAAVSAVAVAAAALDEGLPTQGSQLAAERPEAKAPTKRQNAQTHASSKKNSQTSTWRPQILQACPRHAARPPPPATRRATEWMEGRRPARSAQRPVQLSTLQCLCFTQHAALSLSHSAACRRCSRRGD